MTSAPADSKTTPYIPSAKEWKAIVAPFQKSSVAKSTWQIINSIGPYIGLWCLMAYTVKFSYPLTLALSALAGLFVLRIFIIFHDCGHGSFFKSNTANSIVGFITGMLTFTPYHLWRWEHALHHATCSDLERRGVGDIWTLTVQEYLDASPLKKFVYRVARNPIVMFVIAPAILFLVYQRFSTRGASRREHLSVLFMNLALALMVGTLCYFIGWKDVLIMQLGVTGTAGALGVWMFYVQHQYEDAYWAHHEEWNYAAAALLGSSFYKLPKILQWFSGNIGYHHVHHLSPRIPNYNLERCHNSHPIFLAVKPITLWESFKSLGLRLWDDEQKKLVGFGRIRELRQQMQQAA